MLSDLPNVTQQKCARFERWPVWLQRLTCHWPSQIRVLCAGNGEKPAVVSSSIGREEGQNLVRGCNCSCTLIPEMPPQVTNPKGMHVYRDVHGSNIYKRQKVGHALAGVAQWIECWPANQRPLIQFPLKAHAWVAGQAPSWGCARGNGLMYLLHIDVSLPPSSSFPLFLKK